MKRNMLCYSYVTSTREILTDLETCVNITNVMGVLSSLRFLIRYRRLMVGLGYPDHQAFVHKSGPLIKGYYLKEEFHYMKSLNRTLSLVLVLAMVLGLMGFASAATFTDNTTIQYKEAVGVMSGIGAINGYTDGTFKPTATITREEAAKMITYAILGPTVAKSLTVSTTSFSDVAASRWSAPFISYLVSKGIINGMGDGTFAPTANVTGYQMAKMMLVAIGYGAKNEFVGDAWELNTAVLANKLGVFKNAKTANYSAAATREEAALYVFNAITKVEKVTYSKLLDEYYTDGRLLSYDFDELDGTIAGDTYPTLRYDVVDPEDNGGFGGRLWYFEKSSSDNYYTSGVDTLIGLFNDTETVWSFASGTTVAAIAKAVGVKNSSTTYTIDLYRNDDYKGSVSSVTGASVYDSTASFLEGETKVPNGRTVVVIQDSNTPTTYRFLYTFTYLATVTGVTKDTTADDVDNRAIELSIKQYGASGAAYTMSIGSGNFDGFEAMWTAVKDSTATTRAAAPIYYLVVPYADSYSYSTSIASSATDTKLISAVAPKVVTGTINGFAGAATSGTVNVGGTSYKYAAEYYAGSPAFAADTSTLNTSATLLTDESGYVYGAVNTVASAVYCTVVAYASKTTSGLAGGTTYEAILLFTDGSTKTVELSATPAHWVDSSPADTYVDATSAHWYTYYVNSYGKYVLTEVTTGYSSGTAGYKAAVDKTLTNGVPTFDAMTVNTATVFILRSGAGSTADPYTFKTYTGYTAVPSVASADYLAYVTSTGAAKYVYIYDGTSTAVTDTSVKAVIMSATPVVAYVSSTVTTYTYTAAINGVVSSIVSKAPLTLSEGVLYAVNVGSDGYVVGTPTSAAAAAFELAGATASAGVLDVSAHNVAGPLYGAMAINNTSLDGSTVKTAYTYTGAEYVFVIDTVKGTVTVSTVEALVADEALSGVNYNAFLAVKGTDTTANATAIQAIWAVRVYAS